MKRLLQIFLAFVLFEYEWGKYIRDEYGDTVFNLFVQLVGA
jgi:hypothetical protein